MHILITNRALVGRTGTEVFVRDLAAGLKQLGQFPLVYSAILGPMAEEIRGQGVAVHSNLREIARAPDVIHGHHHAQTLTSLLHFPNTPAVFVSQKPNLTISRCLTVLIENQLKSCADTPKLLLSKREASMLTCTGAAVERALSPLPVLS
jgi:hypothetical protein